MSQIAQSQIFVERIAQLEWCMVIVNAQVDKNFVLQKSYPVNSELP